MLFFVIQVQMSLSTDRLTITFNYSIFFPGKLNFSFDIKYCLKCINYSILLVNSQEILVAAAAGQIRAL